MVMRVIGVVKRGRPGEGGILRIGQREGWESGGRAMQILLKRIFHCLLNGFGWLAT